MGQESAGVIEIRHEKTGKPALKVTALRSEIEDIRSDLGACITELNRRRREAFNVRLQVKRHRKLAITVGAALIALTAGFAAYWANGRVKRPAPEKLRRAAIPEKNDSMGSRVSKAAVGILAGAIIGVVKGGAQRAVSGGGVTSAKASPELAASSGRDRS